MNDSEVWLVHAGCGKTFAARQRDDTLDFVVGGYKYLHPLKPATLLEVEQIKANDGELNPEWPWNYIEALEREYKKGRYRYILAPVIVELADSLRMKDIPFVLVYPHASLKREYETRYVERGNSKDFLTVFIERWERWCTIFESMMHPSRRVILQDGQYLTDVLGGD